VDDKELSGAEEEKEVEKALLKPLLSLEDLVRFSALEGTGGDSLRNLLQRGHEAGAEWPGLEHANIGPYIQKMLAAAAPLGRINYLSLRFSKLYNITKLVYKLSVKNLRLSFYILRIAIFGSYMEKILYEKLLWQYHVDHEGIIKIFIMFFYCDHSIKIYEFFLWSVITAVYSKFWCQIFYV